MPRGDGAVRSCARGRTGRSVVSGVRALISLRSPLVLVLAAACLTGLAGCSSTGGLGGLGGLFKSHNGDAANAAANPPDPADTTGSVNTQPAEPAASGVPVVLPGPLAAPGLLGDDPNDDLQKGKRYFRTNNFGLAEKSFRAAVQKHPRDAEAWVDLAAAYDRLHRFDLADRAYLEAIRLIGQTPEILNDQGFSYMLRGDYARARQKLLQAQAKDPANPYVRANLDLLQESNIEGKSVK
jgi:tetratricopeptide (TPR) repeat protein